MKNKRITLEEYEKIMTRNLRRIKLKENISPWLVGLFIFICSYTIGFKVGLKIELFFLAGYLSQTVFKILSDIILDILLPMNWSK